MARLIDADALYETISDHVTTVSVCPTVDWASGKSQMQEICLEDIANAPTVGGWISVKDRLPNVAGWYLVFYNGSEMQVAFFKGKKWPFDNHYHKVTHWMPLPEPPKEDNDAKQ